MRCCARGAASAQPRLRSARDGCVFGCWGLWRAVGEAPRRPQPSTACKPQLLDKPEYSWLEASRTRCVSDALRLSGIALGSWYEAESDPGSRTYGPGRDDVS